MMEEQNLIMEVAKLECLQIQYNRAYRTDQSLMQIVLVGGLIFAIFIAPLFSWITGVVFGMNMFLFWSNLKRLSVSKIITNHFEPRQQRTLVRLINQKLNTIITPSASDFKMNVASDPDKAAAVAETVISFVKSQRTIRFIDPTKVVHPRAIRLSV